MPWCSEVTRAIPVLFLTTTFDRGGAEKIITHVAGGLCRAKYAVRVAALQGRSQAITPDLTAACIPIHDLGMRRKGDLRCVPRLISLLRHHRTQILFTFMFHPNMLGRVVGRLCGVPIRISSERIMAWEGAVRRFGNRLTAPLATHVVAVSERVAAYAIHEFRLPPGRVTTIVNGVDVEHFRPTQPACDSTKVVIGSTARLHSKNDHATLLRAFGRVLERFPDARLLLVGRGSEEARLRLLVQDLGVASNVDFCGEQSDVRPFLAQMTLYVQSSVAEGLPNSVLEAMAAGLPVVATAVGGVPELIHDGQTGFLVEPGQPSRMADAILKILSDPVLAARFGEAGRIRIEAQFREGVMIQKIESLLDRLVRDHLQLRFSSEGSWRNI